MTISLGKISTVTHTCERLRFEISTAESELAARQGEFDVALAKLNESDARIAALTEQLAVAGQHAKSARAEVERLNGAIAEASAARSRDENELAIAQDQLQHHGDVAEPSHSRAEVIRAEVSTARSVEVEARLMVRTSEERVDSLAARAKALEDAAAAEREASQRALLRRGVRARGAVVSQAIAESAYETLIHIERSIAKAAAERGRLEELRAGREGETHYSRVRANLWRKWSNSPPVFIKTKLLVLNSACVLSNSKPRLLKNLVLMYKHWSLNMVQKMMCLPLSKPMTVKLLPLN